MGKILLRTSAAFLVSLLVTFLLIFGVEVFSNVVHPLPVGTDLTHDTICLHVANYPAWILAVVVPMWGGTATIGTWIAQRIGNVYSAAALGVLLVSGVALNLSMLPYPIWFKSVTLLVVPLAAIAGSRLANRPAKPVASH